MDPVGVALPDPGHHNIEDPAPGTKQQVVTTVSKAWRWGLVSSGKTTPSRALGLLVGELLVILLEGKQAGGDQDQVIESGLT